MVKKCCANYFNITGCGQ